MAAERRVFLPGLAGSRQARIAAVMRRASLAVRSAQRGAWLVCVAVCASALAVGSAFAKDAPHVPVRHCRSTPDAWCALRRRQGQGLQARLLGRRSQGPGTGRTRSTPGTGSSASRTPTRSIAWCRFEIGGSNAITNLWPQHYYEPWGVRTKDRLDDKLRDARLLGHGCRWTLARRQEAANWIKAYKRVRRPERSANGAHEPAPSGSPAGALTGHDPRGVLLPVVPADLGQRAAEPVHELHADARPLQHRRRDGEGADRRHAVRGVSVGLASWFGQGSTTDSHWPALFRAAQGTGFSWAPYYEPEGVSDPTPRRDRRRPALPAQRRTAAGRRWPCCRARACWCSSTTRTISTPRRAARP